jgi:hypothetical protein
MSNWKLNKWLTVLGVFLLLFLTFFRENILLAINALIAKEEYSKAYFYWFTEYFKGLPYEDLVVWKWIATIFFSVTMSIITVLALFSWFKSVRIVRFVGLIYLGTFFFLLLTGGLGFLLNKFDAVYFVLRKILGLVQSPIPFFSFFLLLSYSKKE